jgi:uncharacterized protein YneF (UPF0154 family)
MQDEAIRGGYILLARKMFDSWLMDKPPLWMKLWIWMLGQANWKDRAQLKRGQFITTAEDMREAMSYRVGARIQRPSEKEIRRAYEGLTKGGAVGRAKSTRGMVITVCNYGKYQRFESYEGQYEGQYEKSTKGIGGAHDTEGIRSQEGIKPNTPPISPLSFGEAGKVKMTAEEYDKLTARFGEQVTADYIERLDGYCVNSPKKAAKYNSHYRTVLSWWHRDEKERKQGKPIQHKQRKSKMDEVNDRLNEWAGGANGTGMDQANDRRDDDSFNVIPLEKLAPGQFG